MQRRKKILGMMLALVLLAAACGGSYYLGQKNGDSMHTSASQQIGAIPKVTARVQRHQLEKETDAEAWFLHLLSSEFVNAAAAGDVTVTQIGDRWQTTVGGISAQFNREGVITAFENGDALAGGMQDNTNGLVGIMDDSVYYYLQQFAEGCLPDVSVDSFEIAADRRNKSGRFITCIGGNPHIPRAYSFMIQLEPEVRVVRFELLDSEDRALVRISSMASATTTDLSKQTTEPSQQSRQTISMAQARSIATDRMQREAYSNAEYEEMTSVAANYDETNPDAPLWVVNFGVGSRQCYQVRLDAYTGEVLSFADLQKPTSSPSETTQEQANPASGEMGKEQAIAAARLAVMTKYGFSQEEVDGFLVVTTHYGLANSEVWYEYSPTVNFWIVSLRMPETDPAFLSDYDAFLDAATGEMLIIFDPSNNANG